MASHRETESKASWACEALRSFRGLANVLRARQYRRFGFAPPGDPYSPIPDLAEVRASAGWLFDTTRREIPGINLREAAQLALLIELAAHQRDLPFPDAPSESFRYSFRNGFFGPGDAAVLFSVLLHLRPKRVIEVGSGHSSALMLDVNERFLGGSIRFTFVEPEDERLRSLLRSGDLSANELLTQPVQNVPIEIFRELDSGDILFIDSSHVAKIGSDVLHLLFEVLPVLAEGVVVHVHDVFWPFEYPWAWLEEGRAFNEAYFVRAFLTDNPRWEIMFFNSYLAALHPENLFRAIPKGRDDPGSSLWLRKKPIS